MSRKQTLKDPNANYTNEELQSKINVYKWELVNANLSGYAENIYRREIKTMQAELVKRGLNE